MKIKIDFVLACRLAARRSDVDFTKIAELPRKQKKRMKKMLSNLAATECDALSDKFMSQLKEFGLAG